MSVVNGIEAFKVAMAGHEHEYALIGGGACSILFDASGESFRATKDLDVVVLTDAGGAGFARALWRFEKKVATIAGNEQKVVARTIGSCCQRTVQR